MRAVSLGVFILGLAGATGIFAAEPVALFDGKSLDGWDVITCEAVVQDGAILIKDGNGLVQAKGTFADFVLEFEWKALPTEMWDSGLYFRYSEVPAGRPWPKKYQVNLRKGMEGNIDGFPDGKNTIPTKSREWNKFELTVKGKTAELKVNGQPSWKVEGIEQESGHIALQAEVPKGGQFLFRNIRVTRLSAQ